MNPSMNPAKEKLQRGELVLGVALKSLRSMDVGWILKASGWDWAFIDGEHGGTTLDQAAHISACCRHVGVSPVFRVPGHTPYLASQALDVGAVGIVVPHVETAQQARAMAAACRYPPAGERSFGGPMAQLDYANLPPQEAMQRVNEGVLLVCMIESPRGVEEAEQIAAVEGVDGLLIGSNDLCLSMDLPFQFTHPRIQEAFRHVAEACKRHGCFAGYGGLNDIEIERPYLEMGYRFLQSSADAGLLIEAGTSRIRGLRKAIS